MTEVSRLERVKGQLPEFDPTHPPASVIGAYLQAGFQDFTQSIKDEDFELNGYVRGVFSEHLLDGMQWFLEDGGSITLTDKTGGQFIVRAG